jgi:hypothetical protein
MAATKAQLAQVYARATWDQVFRNALLGNGAQPSIDDANAATVTPIVLSAQQLSAARSNPDAQDITNVAVNGVGGSLDQFAMASWAAGYLTPCNHPRPPLSNGSRPTRSNQLSSPTTDDLVL